MINQLSRVQGISTLMARVGFALMTCLGFIVAACGASATNGSYVYTNNSKVEWLSWSDNNGNLTGRWTGVSYQLPLASNSQPSVSQPVSLTGTANNEAVQLSGGLLSFQGTIVNSVLKIHVTDPSGQTVDQTWVPVSQQDYNDLVMLFNISMHLQGAITDLQNEVKFPTDDSNPASLHNVVKQAQQYVSLLQGKVTNIQEATSHSAQCQQLDLLSQYYPAAPETFQLPYQPNQSRIGKNLATIAMLWNQAKKQTIHIAGLNPPWLFTQTKLDQAQAPGQTAYATLQSTYQNDQKTMSQLQQNYQDLGKAINALKQSCSP